LKLKNKLSKKHYLLGRRKNCEIERSKNVEKLFLEKYFEN
jgi:hypothetical protein